MLEDFQSNELVEDSGSQEDKSLLTILYPRSSHMSLNTDSEHFCNL